MRHAVRIVLIEYLQNFPVLLGLMFALNAMEWPVRLLSVGAGALTSAFAIAYTEHLKLGKHVEQSTTDLVFNLIAFFSAGMLYLVYHALIRSQTTGPLAADIITGILLGSLVGIAQALLVDERRITRQALAHTAGLALASVVVLAPAGAFAGSTPPLLGAAGLCLLMTLVIIRFDYWTLIKAHFR
jgi:hypothetical protein